MKKILGIVLLMFPVACSVGPQSSVMQMHVDFSSPVIGLNSELDVVYPSAAGRDGEISACYGPAWQKRDYLYHEYKFN